VMDGEGRPLIEGNLQLSPLDENGKPKESFQPANDWMMRTDDRGVYRLYGLPAGRYLLSSGGGTSPRRGKGGYPRTFYPDATDHNQAKIIEVKEGDEVVGIDIRLGEPKNAYEAAGRVIDADTGQPLPQMVLMCFDAPNDENAGGRFGGNGITDEEGRFRIKGLSSGRYVIGLWERALGNKEYYSQRTTFELQDADVKGLEVKAIRGSIISGVVVLEGPNDPAVRAKLQQMELGLDVRSKRDASVPDLAYWNRGATSAKIAADGSFHLTGAQPGMATFYVWGAQENAFSIKRVERDGAEVKNDFEIRRGEQVSGVRLVLVFADGTIRGQVEIAGGRLPESWRLNLQAVPIGTTEGEDVYPAFQPPSGYGVVDDKGRFVIERLAAGEYELKLNVYVKVGQNDWKTPPGMKEVKQRVVVNGAAVTPVKFTLDLTRKQEDRR